MYVRGRRESRGARGIEKEKIKKEKERKADGGWG